MGTPRSRQNLCSVESRNCNTGEQGRIGFNKVSPQPLKAVELNFSESGISWRKDAWVKISYDNLLKQNGYTSDCVNQGIKTQQEHAYPSYSYSVHFVKLRSHSPTGRIKIDHVVSGADAGTIVSEKTAASQMICGALAE